MTRARFALALLLPLVALPASAEPATETIRVHAGRLLDGRGGLREDVTVTIAGSRIVAVEPGGRGPLTYDLSGLTQLPRFA
jgi:hypothetical protein